MRKTTKVLVIFLAILVVGIGAYFGHEFYTERSGIAEQEQAIIKGGDSGEKELPKDMVYGHPKTEFLGVVNAYRSRLGNPPVDIADIRITEMNNKNRENLKKFMGSNYKSVKEFKKQMKYGKGFIGVTYYGNTDSGYFIFEDAETGKLRLYCRAFRHKVL